LVAVDGLSLVPTVAELDYVCTQMNTVAFVRVMRTVRNQNMEQFGAVKLVRVVKVRVYI
jgi:hypothetical protein